MALENKEAITLDAIAKHQQSIQRLEQQDDVIEAKINSKEKFVSKYEKVMAWLEKAIPKAQGKIETLESRQEDVMEQIAFHVKEIKQLQSTLNR